MPIFLSYSRQNEETVKSLALGFQAAERQVWYDHDLGGGDAWWDKILDNIRLADVFLFALSDSSLQSKACTAELNYAVALGRPIVPVQVGEVRNFIANPLSKLQVLPFNPDSATAAFKIIAAIDQASRKVQPLPDPLPPVPPIPYAYLLKLREQIDATQDLDQLSQDAVVDQLARALSDETDPSIIATILHMLDNIRSKPWCMRRTEKRIKLIIEEYTASSSGIETPQRNPPAAPETEAWTKTTDGEPETADPGTPAPDFDPTTRSKPPEASSQTWTWTGPGSATDSTPGPASDPHKVFEERMEALGHRPAPEATVPIGPFAPEPQTPESQTPEPQTLEPQIPEPWTPEPWTPEPWTPETPSPESQSPESQSPESQSPSPFDSSAPRTDSAPAPIWMGVEGPPEPLSTPAGFGVVPPQVAAAPPPSPHWVRSILAIALMPVFGVIAFVFAVKVDRRLAESDVGAARRAATTSTTWAVVAIVLGGLSWLLYLISQTV